MQVNKVSMQEIKFKEKFSYVLKNQNIFEALANSENRNPTEFSAINKLRPNAMTAGNYRRAHNCSQNKNNKIHFQTNDNTLDMIEHPNTAQSTSLDFKRRYKTYTEDKDKNQQTYRSVTHTCKSRRKQRKKELIPINSKMTDIQNVQTRLSSQRHNNELDNSIFTLKKSFKFDKKMHKPHNLSFSNRIHEDHLNLTTDESLKEWLDMHDKMSKRQEKNKQKLVEYQEKTLLEDIDRQIEDLHLTAIQVYESNIRNSHADDNHQIISIFHSNINSYFNAFCEIKQICKCPSFIYDSIEFIIRSMKELYTQLETFHLRAMMVAENNINILNEKLAEYEKTI